MQLHPSLTHQLSLARQRDAEHTAARARRATASRRIDQPKAGSPRSTAPIGRCAEPARA
jgi:hypothetical protein